MHDMKSCHNSLVGAGVWGQQGHRPGSQNSWYSLLQVQQADTHLQQVIPQGSIRSKAAILLAALYSSAQATIILPLLVLDHLSYSRSLRGMLALGLLVSCSSLVVSHFSQRACCNWKSCMCVIQNICSSYTIGCARLVLILVSFVEHDALVKLKPMTRMQERADRIVRIHCNANGGACVQLAPLVLWQAHVQPCFEAVELAVLRQTFTEASWEHMCNVYVQEACLTYAFVEAVVDLS